jgi:hypothetical protein
MKSSKSHFTVPSDQRAKGRVWSRTFWPSGLHKQRDADPASRPFGKGRPMVMGCSAVEMQGLAADSSTEKGERGPLLAVSFEKTAPWPVNTRDGELVAVTGFSSRGWLATGKSKLRLLLGCPNLIHLNQGQDVVLIWLIRIHF